MNTELITIDDTRSEAGMATAEYAIGTVSATGIAGILWWLVQQEWFRDTIKGIFEKAFKLPSL